MLFPTITKFMSPIVLHYCIISLLLLFGAVAINIVNLAITSRNTELTSSLQVSTQLDTSTTMFAIDTDYQVIPLTTIVCHDITCFLKEADRLIQLDNASFVAFSPQTGEQKDIKILIGNEGGINSMWWTSLVYIALVGLFIIYLLIVFAKTNTILYESIQ